MVWPSLDSLWEIARSLLAGMIVAGGVIWRSYRHLDGRFDEIDRQLRREAGRVDALELRLGSIATREDLGGIRLEIGEVETRVAAMAATVEGVDRRPDTMGRQIDMLVKHAMRGEP